MARACSLFKLQSSTCVRLQGGKFPSWSGTRLLALSPQLSVACKRFVITEHMPGTKKKKRVLESSEVIETHDNLLKAIEFKEARVLTKNDYAFANWLFSSPVTLEHVIGDRSHMIPCASDEVLPHSMWLLFHLWNYLAIVHG